MLCSVYCTNTNKCVCVYIPGVLVTFDGSVILTDDSQVYCSDGVLMKSPTSFRNDMLTAG